MFSKLAKFFKPKSVKVLLETPSAFNWSHESLPLAVEITNRAEESCTVESIQVQVREKPEGEDDPTVNVWEQGNVARHNHPLGQVLAPGETTRVEIEMPTSIEAAMGEEQPKWMKQAGKAIDAASQRQQGSNLFEVRALVYTAGSKHPKGATKTVGGGLQISSTWGT